MTIKGIDISYAQGVFNHAQAKADGAEFIISKRTEGTAGVDGQFDNNFAGTKAQGLGRGSYHFSRWDLGTDPLTEARFFLSHLPALDPNDFIVLDIEDSPDRVPGRELSPFALTWLDEVARGAGRDPIVYSGAYFASQFLTDARLAKYGLWVAAYGSVCPAQVGPWPFPAMWQHTSSAFYAGKGVDEDYFFGSIEQLRLYGKPAPAPTGHPAPTATHGDGSKFLVLRDMMARTAPDLDAVRQPTQMCYKGAVLEGTGKQTPHWVQVVAGGHPIWLFLPNLQAV